jgi:hypothetical protein
MPVVLTLTGCSTAAPDGTTTYTGTITGGDVIPSFPLGKYAGAAFTVAGFAAHPDENNGAFLCVASTGTTLKLKNPNGVSESHSATASVSWLLACKELGGIIYITRLTQTQDDHIPGIPTPWQPVSPGGRPSIQGYSGNGLSDTQFILTFDYLSHLVCRTIDTAQWPPNFTDPVTPSPHIQIELPEDALAVKLLSSLACTNDSYYFNPVLLNDGSLFFAPLTDTYSTTITLAGGWVPLYLGSATPFYRLYRRPIGTLTWTLIQDWQASTLTFTDSNVGSFRFEYTATWGTGANPLRPSDGTDHNEGIIASGTILTYDSASPSQVFDFAIPFSDHLSFPVTTGKESTNAIAFGDFRKAFLVEAFDEVISLSKASIGNSNNAAPTGGLDGFPEFAVVSQSDHLIGTMAGSPPTSGTALFQASTNAAPAGLF